MNRLFEPDDLRPPGLSKKKWVVVIDSGSIWVKGQEFGATIKWEHLRWIRSSGK